MDGGGPFQSRRSWRLPDGGEATWESRPARKRGTIAIRAKADGTTRTLRAPPAIARRLRRINFFIDWQEFRRLVELVVTDDVVGLQFDRVTGVLRKSREHTEPDAE